MRGHLLSKRGHFFRKPVAGLGAQLVHPTSQRRPYSYEQPLDLIARQFLR